MAITPTDANCQFYLSAMPNRPTRKKYRRIRLQCFLALFLWFLIQAHPADGTRCRNPYERVRENYCYFVADEEPLHTSFHNFCYQDKRTSRVCLDSDEEMRVLAHHLANLGYPNGTQFWSAGHRWPGDNRFYWNYFGRARPLNYSNWAVDEPTPQMGRNCLILTLRGGELIMSNGLNDAIFGCETTDPQNGLVTVPCFQKMRLVSNYERYQPTPKAQEDVSATNVTNFAATKKSNPEFEIGLCVYL